MEQEFVSGVRFFGVFLLSILTAILLLVYHGKVTSQVYNRSRYALVVALVTLVATFSAQFLGHFRETTPCLSWCINILAYSIVCPMLNLAEVNLLRAGQLPRRMVRIFASSLVVIFLLFLFGLFTHTLVDNAAPWRTTTMAICVVYTAMLAVTSWMLHKEMVHASSHLSDDLLDDRHRVLRYTANSLNLVMIFTLFSPWVAMSPSLVLNGLIGLILFPLIGWYVIAFIFYGHNMHEVLGVEDEIAVASVPSVEPARSVEEQNYVAQRVQDWVAMRKFTDESLSLNKATKEMGISSAALNSYITAHYGMSYRSWIPYLRVEHAKKLMTESPNISNEAIAEACGFSSRTAFQRCFADVTGFPPKQWADNRSANNQPPTANN